MATREAEVVEVIAPLMLPRADVFHVESGPRLRRLDQSAVLADVARPLAHLVADSFIHRYEPLRWSTCRAFDCMMLMKSIA